MATATSTPSLTLRALLSRAASKAALDRLAPVTAGLTPAAKALAAVVAARTAKEVTLLVVPTDKDVDQLTADARFFYAALEGASDAVVERAILPLPSLQIDPYRGMTPHFRVAAARARALFGAASGSARLIIASAAAVLPRVSTPDRLLKASLEIRSGTQIEPQDLADLLVDAGFTREDPVDEHGSFTIRGGIVDIFPAADAQPVRIEFVGDMVESMRRYDPATQRSTGATDQVSIVPVRERFDDVGPAEARRDDWEDDWSGGSTAGPDDSNDDTDDPDEAGLYDWEKDEESPAEAGRHHQGDGTRGPAKAGRYRQTEGAGDPVQERRGRLQPDQTLSIVEFLSAAHGVKLLVSEYEQVEQHAQKIREQLASSYADASARGHVVTAPPDEAFVSWSDLEPRAAGARRLEELAIDEGGPEGPPRRSDDGEPDGPPLRSDEGAPQGPRLRSKSIDDVEADLQFRLGSTRHVSCQPALEFNGRVGDWVADVRQARERGDTVLFVADSGGRAERTVEILQEYDILAIPVERAEDAHAAAVLVAVGSLSRGFRLADASLQIYAETDVFEEERRPAEKRRNLAKTFLSDLRDLKVGDLVVHVDHGIGEFVGLKQLGTVGRPLAGAPADVQEFLELRYHGDDKLFVPVERLDLIQKYTGGTRPALDRLGGSTWEKAKTRVKKAMRDMAEELLKLYAQRRAVPGHAFAPDTHWQEEFEDAFPYDLTPDQASAIADIKRDMESTLPMDRLLCGDVGYGKTEVAMRAAFKAVMDGKQAAFLAPTTVLAFQHVKTLRDRFAGFPVTIDVVNRFRSAQETKQILAGVASGKVDIIVGTHRLLSKDVQFKDLGLLVVDEEQRFGVAHKERIKQMRKRVDVLTMTATPIPRTLNMSLVGIRDMSVIETPPKDRLSIQTNVVKFDAPVIERALRNELARGGQVYFVHNRVESIFSIGHLLQRLVPDARIAIGHGQMGEHELEKAMLNFVERRADILLATTIVENGLDIPNANTIIINRADRYGLAQLYQLRGRVGRSDRPAYAYLLIPPQESLSPVARKRLAAIREFSDLGSGFRVAALDLEIRGAGNLLGGEQSGHIDAVGFEMYMKLLEETIRELKGEEIEDDLRATVNLRVDLKIDESYIPDMNQRLMVYRKVAATRTEQELAAAIDEIRDRYGAPPDSVLNLAEYGRIRIMADRLGVDTIDREGRLVVLKFRPTAKIDPTRLVKVVSEWPGTTLVPPVSLKLDLEATASVKAAVDKPRTPNADGQKPGGRGSQAVHPSTPWIRTPTGGLRHVPGGGAPQGARKPSGGRSGEAASSWWTARATTGEVKAGFTKEEILRKPEKDPRAEGGMFARLEGLLRALS
jgi:transcription-repair coupling factor (superfamily II helicase)